MKKRILSFVLSMVMLLMPVASLGEQAVATYYAGELTSVAMDDSYRAGNQINLNAAFGLDFDAVVGDIENADKDLFKKLMKGVIYDLENKIKGKNDPKDILLKAKIEKLIND